LFFVLEHLSFLFIQVFPDGIFPAGGKSEIEGIFPPPYFEWFQFNKVGALDGTKPKSAPHGILIPELYFSYSLITIYVLAVDARDEHVFIFVPVCRKPVTIQCLHVFPHRNSLNTQIWTSAFHIYVISW
jgi:hypothetical protein